MTRVCPENTIDSNVTGFAIAEEVCPGVLPNMSDDGFLPIWYEQEPNSYPNDFGGKLKTAARAPIKRNRQRSKGTTVGLDVKAGFNSDYTQNNMLRHEQGFFFADVREKATTEPMNGTASVLTSVTASTKTIAGTGFKNFRPLQIIAIEGSVFNDGIYTVATSSSTTIVCNETMVDETLGADVVVRTVGEHFAAGGVSISLAGNVGTLVNDGTAPTAATSTLTIAVGNAVDAETVTIGDITYTWSATTPNAAYEVLVGADDLASAINLAGTINGLSTLSPAHPDATAVASTNTVVVTAKIKGTSSNLIPTTETMTNGSWNHATLQGAVGHSFKATGLIGGEYFFLGGDTAGHHFTNNIGYARVGSITDTAIVMDITTWDVEAEAAGALTIDLFVGSLIRNENDPDLIKKRSYQGQRTLGKDADGTQAQYIIGMVPNTMKIDVPLEEKLRVDLNWIAQSEEFTTGAQGLKDGTLFPALDEDAINTTNDVYELGITVLDSTNSNPTRLFGFLSKMELTINNNVSSVKAIRKLGGIGDNVGVFEVSGTATAYFTDVAGNIAIVNNADVQEYMICAKHNKGFVYDIGLLSLGSSGISIAPNKPIELPLTVDAAQNAHGCTLSKTTFQYLPTLAMPEQQ